MTEPPAVTGTSYSHVIVLRDLSTSLSACIYESLCDSDNFVVKQGGARGLSMEELIRYVEIRIATFSLVAECQSLCQK